MELMFFPEPTCDLRAMPYLVSGSALIRSATLIVRMKNKMNKSRVVRDMEEEDTAASIFLSPGP